MTRHVWIEAAARSSGLAPTTRLVLYAMYHYMDAAGHCWPSYAELSRTTGLTERAVRHHVHRAAKAGWLAVEARTGVRNQYRARLSVFHNPPPTPEGGSRVPRKEVPGSRESTPEGGSRVTGSTPEGGSRVAGSTPEGGSRVPRNVVPGSPRNVVPQPRNVVQKPRKEVPGSVNHPRTTQEPPKKKKDLKTTYVEAESGEFSTIGSSSSSSSFAELKTYLGDHAHVTDAAADVLSGASWPYAVLGWFGPRGTRQCDYGDTPKTDRPQVLATALLALIASPQPRMHQSSLAAMVRTAARDLSRPLASERTGEYIAPGKYTEPPDEPITEEGRAVLRELMAETREKLRNTPPVKPGAAAKPGPPPVNAVVDDERARKVVEARRQELRAQARELMAGQTAPSEVAP